MRVLLSTYDSRGGVEPLVGLAVRLRELGAEVRVCATPPSAADVPRLAAGARSVAEKLGIHYVCAAYCPIVLPSPHHPPPPLPGRPYPPEVTNNRVLNDLNVQSFNALFGEALNTHRASAGLPPVDNVRDYVFTGRPWLAADPALAPWQEPADLDVVQAGAWILPDERPLPAELVSFLDAGTPPRYVGFGSMRAPEDIARVAIEAIRAQGRRALVSRGWPWPTTVTTASPSARSTSRHCSAGWPPSCTTAARAPRRPPPGPARLRW
jgi:vancomycin aglycone glucosyltransferase